jgi:hypothetical protein
MALRADQSETALGEIVEWRPFLDLSPRRRGSTKGPENICRQPVNGLLARTVTATRLMILEVRHPAGPRIQLAFRQAGTPREAPLSTRFGRMHLYLGQTCDSIQSEGLHRLRTIGYRYTLRTEESTETQFRWEWEKYPLNRLLSKSLSWR